jgi:hypothetical protein
MGKVLEMRLVGENPTGWLQSMSVPTDGVLSLKLFFSLHCSPKHYD